MENSDHAIQRVKQLFLQLDHSNLNQLDNIYSQDCTFIDPVVHLTSREELKNHLRHQYEGCIYARFEYDGDIIDDLQSSAVIQWRMKFAHPLLNRKREIEVPGVSLIKWQEDHFVHYHRDFYDVSQFIYEQLPFIGKGFKRLRQQLAPKELRN